MRYSIIFFVAISGLCAIGLVVADFFLLSSLSPICHGLTLFLGALGLGAMGRLSSTLAHLFAVFCGEIIFIVPVRKAIGWALGRNIQLAEENTNSCPPQEVEYEKFEYDEVLKGLGQRKIAVHPLEISMAGFQNYLELARYEEYHPHYYEGAPKYLLHKQIQHYLSMAIIPIRRSEIWMDVASASSPFPEILTRLYGIDVYRQDLAYRPGIRGLYIGSNAAAIPLPDESIDRISLHCSFEHFEKNSDSDFIFELCRLLKLGGVAHIIPIYVSNTYQILTNPRYWLSRGVPNEDKATITISRLFWESHGRFYDQEALENRVIRPLQERKLDYRFLQVRVPAEFDYPQFMVLEIKKN